MNQQNPQGQQGWGQPQQGWGQPAQPQAQGQQGHPQGQQGWGQQQHPGMGGMAGMAGGMQTPNPYGPGTSGGGSMEANPIASEATVEQRSKFIERTYMHLSGAIGLFVVLSAGLQMLPSIDSIAVTMLQSWLLVMGLFIGASFIADKFARGSSSSGAQYFGLILYTVVEAVVFIPMIFIARHEIGLDGIMTAGGITLAMFAALTAYVFVTKKDFSFMRGVLSLLAVGAFGLIVASILFGFQLGIAFSIGMVLLACGYILYYTGNVLHHYRINQHVAASLALFSAVALLFWYILRIFMRR